MAEFVLIDLSLPEGAFKVYRVDDVNTPRLDKDRIVAALLSCLPSLSDDVSKIRKKLPITALPIKGRIVSKQKPRSIALAGETVGKLLFHVSAEPKVWALAREILSKYKLSERWLDAILALIMNDAMILPLKSVPEVALSDDPMYLLTQQMARFPNAKEVSRDAAPPRQLIITVNEQMSATELGSWIKQSRFVRNKLKELQKTPYSRMGRESDEALYWGHFVWAYKEFIDKHAGTTVIEKWLDGKLADDVPESRALNVYYKRFLGSRDRFIP